MTVRSDGYSTFVKSVGTSSESELRLKGNMGGTQKIEEKNLLSPL